MSDRIWQIESLLNELDKEIDDYENNILLLENEVEILRAEVEDRMGVQLNIKNLRDKFKEVILKYHYGQISASTIEDALNNLLDE